MKNLQTVRISKTRVQKHDSLYDHYRAMKDSPMQRKARRDKWTATIGFLAFIAFVIGFVWMSQVMFSFPV